MSAVKINISGVKVNGNASILNNMEVSGKSNVNVGIKQSEINGNAKVLNDLDVKDGELKVDIQDVKLGRDANFMNNRTVTREKEKDSSTYATSRKQSEKENRLGKVLSKILGKAVKSDDIMKPVQSAKSERMKFAKELGNGIIVIDEQSAIKEMKEKEKEEKAKEINEKQGEREN